VARIITIAARQHPIEFLGTWDAYVRKIAAAVAEATRAGARLLVFPEYGAMELTSLLPEEVQKSLSKQLDALQGLHDDFVALYKGLAQRHGVYIVAPSLPVRQPDGRFHNRAYVLAPDGGAGFQDKLTMTRFEAERWGISPARALHVFDSALGSFAVAICYDAEFPLIVRRVVEAGAGLILVPSCTDGLAGFNRVRVACQARAMENQCFVAQSPTVGDAPWSEAVDRNVGAAGVFGPIDVGFPSDGVLAQGRLNEAAWVTAEVDLDALERVRRDGQVLNHRDWGVQDTADAPPVSRARL
jgi:predicted amidohydrolase